MSSQALLNSDNSSKSITSYIFILITALAVFALIIISYLLWQFKLSADTENRIKQYHLPSIEYLNNIETEYHLLLDWFFRNKLHNENALKNSPDLHEEKEIRVANFLHVTNRSLTLLFELHNNKGISDFDSSVKRLKNHSDVLLKHFAELSNSNEMSATILDNAHKQLEIARSQLQRLHNQAQQQLFLKQAKSREFFKGTLFFVLLFIIGIASYITYRIICLIKNILKKQKDNTRELTEFKNSLDATTDCVFIFSADDLKFTYVNKGAIKQVKYTPAELMQMHPFDIKPLYSESEFRDMIFPLANSEQNSVTFETIHEDKTGQHIPVEIFLQYIHPSNEKARFVAIVRDITLRKQTFETINFLAKARPTENLEPFLQECIHNLTDVYNCKYAFIGLLIEPERTHVRTLAVRAGNHYAKNFEYPLEGTPCKDIINQEKSLIETKATELYPDDQMLIDMGVDSYFGSPLIISNGKTIGLVSVLDTKPMKPSSENTSILDVFSTRLATEFERNTALKNLEEHQEHLEETVNQRTADLEKAKQQAEEASKSKSIFLSNMSHELRTPMNAILGFAQVLEVDITDEDHKQSINEIIKAGDHLLELINEVLDLTKIEAGHLNLSIDRVSFIELIDDCTGIILPLIEKNNIEFINNIPGNNDYLVRMDFTRAKQVLLNLLSNAIKYNRSGGYVSINVETTENSHRLRVSITDSGQGLSLDQQNKLFKPFERAGAEYSNVEGTGIGLVISKQLMELMGGSIGLKSTPGVGSTFWVEFELEEVKTLSATGKDSISGDEKIQDNTKEHEQQKTILYIEDNPANLRLIEVLLRRRNDIKLETAHEPVLGLDLAKSTTPDLILLDINLPGMNGYEVLKILKTTDQLKHIPVIAISAHAMAGDIRHGMEAGFSDYLSKPVKLANFYACIDKFLPTIA